MTAHGTIRSRLPLLRSPVGWAAAVGLGLFVVAVTLGPVLLGEPGRHIDPSQALQGPSRSHPFGTDELGRDLFARVVLATRISLGLSVLATLLGAAAGILVGVTPLVTGPRVGRLIGQGIAMALAFPALLLALFTTAVIGAGARGLLVAIALAMTPVFARLTQTLAASIKNSDYLLAARMLGASRTSIVVRHVLPNIGGPLLVTFMIGISGALVVLSGMSFLGLGVQSPSYDWGSLLNRGLNRIYTNPAYALGPAFAVLLGGVVFSIVGDALALVLGLRAPVPRARLSGGAAPQAAMPTGHAGSAGPAGEEAGEDRLVSVEGLQVRIPLSDDAVVAAVREFGIEMGPGERVGLVGESGSGKSVSALALAALVEQPAVVTGTRLEVLGADLASPGRRAARAARARLGRSLGMVFQDPFNSFNPLMRIGTQLAESAVRNSDMSRSNARRRAVEQLAAVQLPDPATNSRQFPHQHSGGMLQRSMIAMGLMNQPRLIVADEPTTALDVTVQKEVLGLLRSICDDTGAGLLFISHDLAVVLELCERVVVMYGGRVVEELSAEQVRAGDVRHPYTQGLLASVIDLATPRGQALVTIPGRPPSAVEEISGCAFAPRCALQDERCGRQPVLVELGSNRRAACWQVTGDDVVAERHLAGSER